MYPQLPQPDVNGAEPQAQNEQLQHHSVYCPNCSTQLTAYRCKLICEHCGYYLSCADYY